LNLSEKLALRERQFALRLRLFNSACFTRFALRPSSRQGCSEMLRPTSRDWRCRRCALQSAPRRFIKIVKADCGKISGARCQHFVTRLLDSRERCTQIGIITRRALFDFGNVGRATAVCKSSAKSKLSVKFGKGGPRDQDGCSAEPAWLPATDAGGRWPAIRL